jgi:asparagine synthase (glutamine-hydrolysing)
MCGINGIISRQFSNNVHTVTNLMNNQIIHRGPDDDGFYEDHGPGFSIGMAMRRLSIIDLTTGKQPIYSEDKSKVIVFNGEIYNYRLLKEMMIKNGAVFHTTSDTEIVLRLYEQYGAEAFGMLDGMFAVSIYDKALAKVFIARDLFGEKPLYYSKTNQQFAWCSELKSIKHSLDKDLTISKTGLNLFFQLTYIPAPFTIYNEVFKLEPNKYISFDCKTFSFEISEIKQQVKNYYINNFSDAKRQLQTLLEESVETRSISDVPLGTFLSGGVDSSIVSYCLAKQKANKIDTFSIGFEKKSFDESEDAKTVAKLIGSKHHLFIIGERDLVENVGKVLNNFDEPFADSSAIATYLVSSKAAQHIKVALTGDGGDEVFGGYNKYYIAKLNKGYTSIVPEKFHGKLVKAVAPSLALNEDDRGMKFKINKLLNSIDYSGDYYYNIISLGFQREDFAGFINPEYMKSNVLDYYKTNTSSSATVHDLRKIDRHLSLEGDMLVKVDRSSMLSSLECRAPFLNKTLWDFSSSLPPSYLIKGFNKKHILKKTFAPYFPKGFFDKKKQGFGVPVGDWLKTVLKAELLSYVESGFIKRQNLFKEANIRELVINHVEGKIDNTFKVWTFYCFQKWYKDIYER